MSTKAMLHICLSKGWGGLEMYPIRTGAKLAERNWHVLGLCIKGTAVAKAMRKQGFTVFEVNSKQQALRQLWAIKNWLIKHHVTHIHCHKSGDLAIAALLDSIGQFRVFFTEHMGGNSRKHDVYHRWIYRHVERVFSISDFTRQKNLQNLPIAADKITKLWLGTDALPPILDNKRIKSSKATLGIPLQAKVIGTLGRLDPGKGQAQLIEAFKLMAQHQPELHLLIVGGLSAEYGSDEDYVRSLQQQVAATDLGQRIHFSDFRQDTAEMLAVMDIVCLLSKEEAFGLTVIEAMMAAKVVVGSNSGAIPEILQQEALLVSADNPADIAKKCLNLLAQDQQALTEHLQQRANQHFSITQHIDKLEQYYQQ